MSDRLYTYYAYAFTDVEGPDWKRWKSMYRIFGSPLSFNDRRGNLKVPIKTATRDLLRMPSYDSSFSMSYEECCYERVHEIVKIQDEKGVPIKLLYSGGIDSSLILTSFIKVLGVREASKRIQVLLSQDSVAENPVLWSKFIRPHFEIMDSEKFHEHFNKDSIMMAGEGNDQLFGSDIYKDVGSWGGHGILDKAYEDNIIPFMMSKSLTKSEAEYLYDLFKEYVIDEAECPIITVADFWWYMNFCCKWEFVYHRSLLSIPKTETITPEYMNEHFFQFYQSDNFQKWSMVNRTEKHKGDFTSYKFHAKELVIKHVDEPGDPYRLKIKNKSLPNLIRYKKICDAIDSDYKFQYDIDPMKYYNPNNSYR
jgi:hypothetical protein